MKKEDFEYLRELQWDSTFKNYNLKLSQDVKRALWVVSHRWEISVYIGTHKKIPGPLNCKWIVPMNVPLIELSGTIEQLQRLDFIYPPTNRCNCLFNHPFTWENVVTNIEGTPKLQWFILWLKRSQVRLENFKSELESSGPQ